MRIGLNFHSVDSYISGVEYYCLGLLNSLLDIDKTNDYVLFTNRTDLIESHIIKHPNLTIRNCSFLKNRLHRIIWEQLRLPILAAEEKLDILHCCCYICPAVKSSAEYVVTIHDTIAIDYPQWCKASNALYYNLTMKKTAQASAKIIAVSKFARKQILNHLDIDSSKIETIYPGIDSNIFNSSVNIKKQNQIRIKYKLPKNYILYCGNIEPKKNILNLLKAFKLLRKNSFKCNLVITGQRNWKSKKIFRFLHKEFKLEEVALTGYINRSDMGDVYKMARALILPSFCEGFGFPALEAFACGLAVAASKTGILQEINPNAYTAINPDDHKQIAASIAKILTNHKLRQQQIKIAATEVKKFNPCNCAAKTLDLYEKIIRKKNTCSNKLYLACKKHGLNIS